MNDKKFSIDSLKKFCKAATNIIEKRKKNIARCQQVLTKLKWLIMEINIQHIFYFGAYLT